MVWYHRILNRYSTQLLFIYLFVRLLCTKQQKHIQTNTRNLPQSTNRSTTHGPTANQTLRNRKKQSAGQDLERFLPEVGKHVGQ